MGGAGQSLIQLRLGITMIAVQVIANGPVTH